MSELIVKRQLQHNRYGAADWHIGHKKIWKPRGFNSLEEHDMGVLLPVFMELESKDTIIVAGDVFFGSPEEFAETLRKALALSMKLKFNAKRIRPDERPTFNIKVVNGNHDSNAKLEYLKQERWITSYQMHLEEYIHGHPVVISHFPVHPICLDRWHANGHGHIHSDFCKDPLDETKEDPRYRCMSWERYRKPMKLTDIFAHLA